MDYSNADVAKLLREMAAAYSIRGIGNIFQIRAYEGAADSIEHSAADVKDLWEEGKLDQIPGLGEKIRSYIDELFKTGKIEHFEEVKKDIPEVTFKLLRIPGVGPKTAIKLAEMEIKSIEDLQKQIENGEIIKKGLSVKTSQNILAGIKEVLGRDEGRMLLPVAFAHAEKVLEHIRQCKDVIEIFPLGSLRRMNATIGDLDFAASSKNPKKVIDYFVKMPIVGRIVDQGEAKAVVILRNGIHVDLLVGKPDSYGALLQHFTGSKHHNIHLRTLAEKKGLSLSEYGVKNTKTGEVIPIKEEQGLYKLLNMDTPEAETREDRGEIEAAIKHTLPKLVTLGDIKGDLHLHSNFPLEPSHGPGANSIEEIVQVAKALGYDYVGISDHPPAFTSHSKEKIIELIKTRTKVIQQINMSTKSIRVLNALEIDILGDGSLSVPDEALVTLDYCIAGIHSGHRGSKEQMTKRLLKALASPHLDIIAHPTNRLINERDSSDIDWPVIFEYCAKNKKLLEIDGYPNRLDLRDDLVKLALKYGVKFTIDTDAHAISQMGVMKFGVSVARRGWATKENVVNAWDWTEFKKWFNIPD